MIPNPWERTFSLSLEKMLVFAPLPLGVSGSWMGALPTAPPLFMLVSALMGLDRMQAAYRHAIEQGYRFYSYGDSSLLLAEG